MPYNFEARVDNAIKCSGTGFFKAGPEPPAGTPTQVQSIIEGTGYLNLLAQEVETDGDWLFVSETGNNVANASVYIYKWSGSAFTKTQTLTGGTNYGGAMDVRGGHAIIMGQSGVTQFYTVDASTGIWSIDTSISFGSQIFRYPDSYLSGGKYVQISEDGTVAALTNKAGTVKIYRYNNGTWSQDGTDITAGIGTVNAITISGDGTKFAVCNKSVTPGLCKVYGYDGVGWNVLQTISQDTVNFPTTTNGEFGIDAQFNDDGSFLCIGQNKNQSANGRVFFFQETSINNWTLVQTLVDDDSYDPVSSSLKDNMGHSIEWDPVNKRFLICDAFESESTLGGDTYANGDPYQKAKIGEVFVFEYQNGQWTEIFAIRPPGLATDYPADYVFGKSSSLYGNRLIAAAPGYRHNGEIGVGKLHVFTIPY